MKGDPVREFEEIPGPGVMDETDRSLRAYVAGLPVEKLARYRPDWSAREVMEWDGNFRSDGALMLVCCERDVDVEGFRRVVEERLALKPG